MVGSVAATGFHCKVLPQMVFVQVPSLAPTDLAMLWRVVGLEGCFRVGWFRVSLAESESTGSDPLVSRL